MLPAENVQLWDKQKNVLLNSEIIYKNTVNEYLRFILKNVDNKVYNGYEV